MTSRRRSRRIVVMDFQNLGVAATAVPAKDRRIREQVDRMAPEIAPDTGHSLFKAFCRPESKRCNNRTG